MFMVTEQAFRNISSRGGAPCLACSLAVLDSWLSRAALCWAAGTSAAEPASRLKAHLDAGEFGPALDLAQQAGDARQRDALLGQVAAAQATFGMRGEALATASMIDGDVARNTAVNGATSSPPASGAGRFGFGGGPQPDFQSLIDLITATVAPTTWDDVGGPGSVAPFVGGVWVDAAGAMHRLLEEDLSRRLDRVRDRAGEGGQGPGVGGQGPGVSAFARRTAALRKVSLPRLERAVQLRLASGRPLAEEMRLLAGLQKIQYVLVYPETGDLVLAGPAGDWQPDREGRLVGVESGQPVLQLDDLVVILRHMKRANATFGCSITPPEESLARTKAFLEQSSRTPLKPGGRDPGWPRFAIRLGRRRSNASASILAPASPRCSSRPITA